MKKEKYNESAYKVLGVSQIPNTISSCIWNFHGQTGPDFVILKQSYQPPVPCHFTILP